MYTSLLKSLTLNSLCQMANSINLHSASYINPKITVKSELVEQLNEYFNNYPGVFHDIKMNYFSVKGEPIHQENLTLATNSETGTTYVLLRELYPDLEYTPVPEDMEVFQQVCSSKKYSSLQPTCYFSLIQHKPSYNEELDLTIEYVPLGSVKFISHHDLALLNQKF